MKNITSKGLIIVEEFILDSNTVAAGSDSGDTFYIGTSNYPVENVTVRSDGGNDQIYNQNGTRAYIDAGDGDDYIYLYNSSSQSTVVTGAGNDSISSFATGLTQINAGAGSNLIQICDDADLIIRAEGAADNPAAYTIEYFNGASIGGSTLIGAGNGVLNGTANADLFIQESGNNTIVSYGGEDTIRFAVNRSSVNGDDVVLIGADGSRLVVKNAAGHTLTVQANENSSAIASVCGGAYTTSPQDVIKKFMHSLNNTTLVGIDAVNEAVRAASDGAYLSVNALISDMTLDARNHGANNFLRDDCGIILDNQDTGAISGWDAGGSTVKTDESIVPEDGAMLSFSGNSFTVDGLTVKLDRDFNRLTTAQQQIVRGLYTWWTKGALDLIKESYGSEFSFDEGDVKTSAKTITLDFTNTGTALAFVMGDVIDGETSEVLSLTVNMRYYNSVSSNNVNGESSSDTAGYLDRTLAHEFTHAIMAATVNDFYSLPAYISEGMAELTHGIDDERGNDLEALAENPSYIVRALSSSEDNVNSFGGINAPSYAGGYMLLRYLAKKFSTVEAIDDGTDDGDNTLDSGDTVVDDTTSIEDDTTSIEDDTTSIEDDTTSIEDDTTSIEDDTTSTIGDDTVDTVDSGDGSAISNSTANTLVSGSSAAESIINNAADYVTIRAGDGDDSLYNGYTQYSTVAFGSGTVQSYGGEYVVLDGEGGDDYIYVQDGNHSTIDGGAGNDTIINGTVAGGVIREGASYITINGGDGNDDISNIASAVSINGGRGDDTIWNNHSDDVTIDGGDGDDLISLSAYNGATVLGGEGDDTITGSGSRRIYQFTDDDDDDLIVGYQSSDTVQILDDANYFTLESGSDLIVSLDGGSITLVDASDKTLNIDGGTFDISPLADPFTNYTPNSILSGTADADSLYNYAGGTTIRALDGDDYIFSSIGDDYTVNNDYGYVTIDGGNGNDTVVSYDAHVSINAGAGNDLIDIGSRSDVTVNVGNGNNTITGNGSNRLFIFSDADAANVITAVKPNDTIVLNDDEIYSTIAADDDLIIRLSHGTITLNDAHGLPLNIAGGTASIETVEPVNEDIINIDSNVSIAGGDGDDLITNLGRNVTITGGAGADRFQMWQNSSAHITDLTDEDALDVFSSDTGGFNYSITRDGLTLTDTVSSIGVTLDGVTSIDEVADIEVNLFDLEGNRQSETTLGNLVNVDSTLPDGVKLNKKGTTLTVKKSFVGTLNASYYGDSIKTIKASSNPNALELIGNDNDNVIKTSKGGSTLDGGAGDDTLVGGNGSDVFIYDGRGDDVIKKYKAGDSVMIVGSIDNTSIKGSNVILTVGDGTLTIKGAARKELTILESIEAAALPADDPLAEIMSTEAAVDLSTELITPSARSWQFANVNTPRGVSAERSHKNITDF